PSPLWWIPFLMCLSMVFAVPVKKMQKQNRRRMKQYVMHSKMRM
ncbi:hypothetical protein RUMTOR_02871, partial [[Ruminococcus] torques ATCC 27756]